MGKRHVKVVGGLIITYDYTIIYDYITRYRYKDDMKGKDRFF